MATVGQIDWDYDVCKGCEHNDPDSDKCVVDGGPEFWIGQDADTQETAVLCDDYARKDGET